MQRTEGDGVREITSSKLMSMKLKDFNVNINYESANYSGGI